MSRYESLFAGEPLRSEPEREFRVSFGSPTEEELAAVVLAVLALSAADRRRSGASHGTAPASWCTRRRVSQARGGRHVPPAAWPGLFGPGRAAAAALVDRGVPTRV